MQSPIWLPVLFVAILSAISGALACDRYTGPAGETQCVKATIYSGYQCATCLSNAYILEKSRGAHVCRDSARYCWYQCMLESFNIEEGPVYGECECKANEALPQPPVILPADCYSPDGTDCDWYRQCLSKRFSCSGHLVEHTASYGEEFCNLYQDYALGLGNESVQWVDAVRKCFEVSLVSLLRLCQSEPTCDNVQKTALESHTTCYKSPYLGSSVCSIPVTDWLRIFWSIKGSFASSEFVEILKNSVTIAADCGGAYGTHIDDRVYSLETWVWDTAIAKRETWSNDEIVHAIVNDISSSLGWEQNSVIGWYAFFVDGPIQSPPTCKPGKGLKILMFVEDREDIGLIGSSNRKSLAQTISDLSASVEQGMTGTITYYHYDVTSLLKCTSEDGVNNGCRGGTELATGPPQPTACLAPFSAIMGASNHVACLLFALLVSCVFTKTQ